MAAVATVYCRLPKTLQESRLLLKKTFFVMVFFFVYIAVQVFCFTNRIITVETGAHQYFAVWLIVAITYPASLLLFPLAFVFNFYSTSELCRATLCCYKCVKMKSRTKQSVQRQPTCATHNVRTFRDSSRVSLPSHTFFHIPYTNEFTRITTENAPLVRSEGEAVKDPCVTSNESTDYGSVANQQESKLF